MKPTRADREAAEAIGNLYSPCVISKDDDLFPADSLIEITIARHMIPERERARRETVVRQALADEVRKSQPNHPAVFISNAFDRAAAEALDKEPNDA